MLASVMALGLAGCETGNNLLSGNSAPAPQAALADTQQPAASTRTARVEVAPIIGAPEAVARDLQAQLSGAMERSKISVARGPESKGEYVLRGYIVAAREKAGSKISYIWDVTDQSGKRANRITGEEFAAGVPGKDPWSSVTPQIVQNIADKTAAQIAAWLPGNSGTPVASNTSAPAMATQAEAQPVKTAQTAASQAITATPAVASAVTPVATPAALTTAPSSTIAAATASPQAAASAAASTTGSIENGGGPTTVVSSVTGAPGDGSTSLSGAIQRELGKSGVSLASSPNAQAYKVEGKVAVGQGKDGKQPIQIDWNVIDPKGKKLGTVSQKNEVPQGSLDGAWGKTADLAAQAAAQGILKLLPQKSAAN